MSEKLLEVIQKSTYYPRKLIDFIIYHTYLKNKNNWEILDKYLNKDILIVGNGPSLNQTPLESVRDNFVSIGMNKINLLFDKSKWRPDIITCVNGYVINQNKNFFNSTEIIVIVPTRAFYLGVKPRKNIIFINMKDQDKLEDNIKKVLSTTCTVTFTAMQIAAYLSPKSVNIVGVDHSFKVKKGPLVQKYEGDDENHFSKEYFKNQYWGLPDLKGSEKLYHIAKEYFENKNIPITDFTINGKLDIFNKADIEKLC